ncbi:MAG: tetratricopeptide repeat protein [Candidatus Hodarchaeota archaeon]
MISNTLKDLYEKGKYQEILDRIAQIEAQEEAVSLTEAEQIHCLYYRSRSLESIGQFEEALQVAITARTQFSSLNNTILSLMLVIAHLYPLWRLNRLDEALRVSEEGNTVLENLTTEEQQTERTWLALFDHIKGLIYLKKAELDTALDYLQRGLTIRETLGISQDLAWSLFWIGNVYHTKGELESALDYYGRSLAIFEALEYTKEIGPLLINMGYALWSKGELDKALKFYHRNNVLCETLGNSQGLAWSLYFLGTLYRHKGEFDTALEYWQQSLNIFETVGNDTEASYPLLSIIVTLALDQQNYVQAQKDLQRLQKLYERTPNEETQHHKLLAEGLVLKQSKRMVDKAQAQATLQQLVNKKNLPLYIYRLGIIHLCELFLIEVKSFGDPAAWEEAKTLIHQLSVQAQAQTSALLTVDALLLQAKVAVVDGDLSQAQKYYDQARDIAAEKKLGLRMQQVKTEKERFEAEFKKWQDLIQRNVSLQERLAKAQLDDYIQQVQKKIKCMKD